MQKNNFKEYKDKFIIVAKRKHKQINYVEKYVTLMETQFRLNAPIIILNTKHLEALSGVLLLS